MSNTILEQKFQGGFSRATIQGLLRELTVEHKTYLVALALMTIACLADLALPYALKVAIDTLFVPLTNREHLSLQFGFVSIITLLILITVVRFIAQFFYNRGIQEAALRTMQRIRQATFAHMACLPMRYFDSQPTGRVVARLTSDVDSLYEFYGSIATTIVRDTVLIFGSLGLMLSIDTKLSLVVLVGLCFILLATSSFGQIARSAYRETSRVNAALLSFVSQSLGGLLSIRSLSREGMFARSFAETNDAEMRAGFFQTRSFAVYHPTVALLGSVVTAVVLFVGAHEVLLGRVSLGGFVAFLSYTELFFAPLRDISEKYNQAQSSLASAERVFALQSETPELSLDNAVTLELKPLTIEFRNVWFAYNDENWVLKDVSCQLSPGQFYAFVGATGSGKSTFLQLLLGLYPVVRGEILINGISITRYNLRELRSLFSIITQEVTALADLVGASPKILSPGERQHIAVQEGISSPRPMLILDEATAQLDAATEHELLQLLQAQRVPRTTIAVVHRLALAEAADQVFVFRNGEIVERGSPIELRNRGGLYAAYLEMQGMEEA